MKSIFMVGLLSAAVLAMPGIALSEPDRPASLAETRLRCQALDQGNQRLNWSVQLDESMPLAIVDEEDMPAQYSVAHIRVHLAAGGPSLLIGRVTGRFVLAALDGSILAKGNCVRQFGA